MFLLYVAAPCKYACVYAYMCAHSSVCPVNVICSSTHLPRKAWKRNVTDIICVMGMAWWIHFGYCLSLLLYSILWHLKGPKMFASDFYSATGLVWQQANLLDENLRDGRISYERTSLVILPFFVDTVRRCGCVAKSQVVLTFWRIFSLLRYLSAERNYSIFSKAALFIKRDTFVIVLMYVLSSLMRGP